MDNRLFEKKNVVGVGTGYKIKDGTQTKQLSLVVMVETKFPLSYLSPFDQIPKIFMGFPTDVVEVGKIEAFSTTGKHRPAPGGVSIGHYKITAGTFGATVRDTLTSERYILSNNHVLANSNDAEIGDAIYQPGPYDGVTSDDIIALLYDYVPINFEASSTCPIAKKVSSIANRFAIILGSHSRLYVASDDNNLVDCAIALPLNDEDILDEILTIGTVNGTAEAELDMPLRKYGRTTDYTEDKVLILGAAINVSYGQDKLARFDGQIVAGPMSAPGDSGSLVLNGNKAVGLLFAGSDTHTIMSPIEFVLDELGVEFAS